MFESICINLRFSFTHSPFADSMENERNLDALLQELDEGGEDDVTQGGADAEGVIEADANVNPCLDALIHELEEGQDDDDESTSQLRAEDIVRSPRNRLNNTVSKYISSSSARRRIIKQNHCKFCQEDLNRETFEAHLRARQNCLTLYLRKLHLTTLEAVILKIFPCFFCDMKFQQLRHHLQTQPECLQQFQERFNVTSLSAVMKKVMNLKRQEYKSRRSLERHFQTSSKAAENKKARLQKETVDDYLNKHCHQTAFSNFKRCCNCLCDLSSAEEVSKDTDIVQNIYDFETFAHHKRADKYFLCQFCRLKKETVPELGNSCFIMKGLEDNNKIVFVPEMKPVEHDEINLQPFLQSYNKNIKVMIPTSTKSIASFKEKVPRKKLSSFQIQNILYGNKFIDNEMLGHIYHNQLTKYLNLENYGDLFQGEIADYEKKILFNLEHCSLENNIRGSSKWKYNRDNEVHKKLAQFGRFCVFLAVEIPVDHQTVATRLIQKGFVVTTNYNGAASQELNRVYLVHQGHDASTDCDDDDCQKITIEEYLQANPEELWLTNENVATYICSVDNFVNSFISNIVSSPVFPLSAQEYHFRTKFNEDGIAYLEGLIWPQSLQKINFLNIDKSLNYEKSQEIKQDYLRKIKSSIASTSDMEVLKRQFSLSEADCEKIQTIVAKYQMHYCGTCVRCLNPPLPSLETMLCVAPDNENEENILVSERFSQLFRSRLLIQGQQNIERMTTFEWAESIFEEIEHEIIQPNSWRIVHEDEEFQFKVDLRLSNLIEQYDYCVLLAAYHYSISCVSKKDEAKVILERPHLSDCYLKPFSPFISKAAAASTNIQIVNSSQEWNNLVWLPPSTVRTERPLIEHCEVPLTEALVLLDETKLNIKASSGVEYVRTGMNNHPTFKKRRDPMGNCFTLENQTQNYFECLETFVSRFLKRINGKDLLLCEVATYYDYVGSEKSDELFEVYKNKIDRIELTEDQCVTGAFYPKFILADFGDFGHVLKKRRRQKVLSYPHFDENTKEFKYSQVLLYHNVQSIEDLTREAVEESFLAIVDGGERVIERNRRLFLMKARASDDWI